MTKIETEIVKAFKKDTDLFIQLVYRYYHDDLIRWLHSKFKVNDNDAENIFQASVVKLYENIVQGKLKEFTSSPKTYFLGIGKNVYRDYSRRKKNVDSLAMEPYVKYEDPKDDIAQKVDFEEKLEQVENILKSMGPPCYPLLQLFYFEKKSWKDIAVRLSYKNANSAKNMKYKCEGKIRERINSDN